MRRGTRRGRGPRRPCVSSPHASRGVRQCLRGICGLQRQAQHIIPRGDESGMGSIRRQGTLVADERRDYRQCQCNAPSGVPCDGLDSSRQTLERGGIAHFATGTSAHDPPGLPLARAREGWVTHLRRTARWAERVWSQAEALAQDEAVPAECPVSARGGHEEGEGGQSLDCATQAKSGRNSGDFRPIFRFKMDALGSDLGEHWCYGPARGPSNRHPREHRRLLQQVSSKSEPGAHFAPDFGPLPGGPPDRPLAGAQQS